MVWNIALLSEIISLKGNKIKKKIGWNIALTIELFSLKGFENNNHV